VTTSADRLVSAVLRKVKQSGLLESGVLKATVSAVNPGGTVTVTRGADTYPKVRLLSGYSTPKVGDAVQIMRTVGGWVCVGKVRTSSGPKIQMDQTSCPSGGGTAWTETVVTFPVPFTAVPKVFLTVASGINTAGAHISLATNGTSTTGFTARCLRDTAAATFIDWVAHATD